MTKRYETDVCIIGSGITGTLVAQKIARETNASVLVVEAGRSVDAGKQRAYRSSRFRNYEENPFPGDVIPSHLVKGAPSQTMAVGGRATHWGGQTPRYAPEDFTTRVVHGVGANWPISYNDLEPFYTEAEWMIGVSGHSEKGAERSRPYPMAPLPLGFNRKSIMHWLDGLGLETWQAPSAINSVAYDGRSQCVGCNVCNACPQGARYSPDSTLGRLLDGQQVHLLSNTFVRRLETNGSGSRILQATGRNLVTGESISIRAGTFVLATSTHWTPYLLLASANSKFPRGLANRSGLVGRYVAGHYFAAASAPFPEMLYPHRAMRHALFTDRFMREPARSPGVRFGLYIMPQLTDPRFETREGKPLLGDEILKDWRKRATPRVVFRAWVEVLSSRESRVTLDPKRRTPDGDPLPRIDFVPHRYSENLLKGPDSVFADLGQFVAGLKPVRIERTASGHMSGGCRMGTNPATSVCDSFGRCHDHENLFLAGAPVCVTGGACHSTLTFAALGLRTASLLVAELG